MKFKKLSQKPWYNGAVIACIGVAFYVLLTHFGSVLSALSGFLRNFRVIILGIVFAYVMNPLANFFSNKVLRKMKTGPRRWTLSVLLTVVTALLALLFLIGTLIPQLVTSVAAFSENIDGYADSAIRLLEGSFLERFLDADRITTLSQNALNSIISFVRENAGRILSSAANSGKNVISAVISLILAIYLLDSETAYCLLPYADDKDGMYPIRHGKEYTFFSRKMYNEDENTDVIDEYAMTTEDNHQDLNQFYFIFSPQEFTKADDTFRKTDDGTIYPRMLSWANFQKWIMRTRSRDKKMSVQTKYVVINPAD